MTMGALLCLETSKDSVTAVAFLYFHFKPKLVLHTCVAINTTAGQRIGRGEIPTPFMRVTAADYRENC